MVTVQEAYQIARSYSKEMGEVYPDIFLDVKAGKDFDSCFYFDFTIVDKFGDRPKEPPMLGGAPGVIVDKITGAVKIITFGELAKMK